MSSQAAFFGVIFFIRAKLFSPLPANSVVSLPLPRVRVIRWSFEEDTKALWTLFCRLFFSRACEKERKKKREGKLRVQEKKKTTQWRRETNRKSESNFTSPHWVGIYNEDLAFLITERVAPFIAKEFLAATHAKKELDERKALEKAKKSARNSCLEYSTSWTNQEYHIQ